MELRKKMQRSSYAQLSATFYTHVGGFEISSTHSSMNEDT